MPQASRSFSDVCRHTLLQLHLVETEAALARSLDDLRASMLNDGVVAIDLEWTPDTVSGANNSSPVALMQLASSEGVLLIRLCRMNRLPQPLRDFLRCACVKLQRYDDASNPPLKIPLP